ncbi:hypothetical protein MTO96_004088 [Rhipicephalus appendiculatus]
MNGGLHNNQVHLCYAIEPQGQSLLHDLLRAAASGWSITNGTGRHSSQDESSPNAPLRLSVLEGEPTSLPCPINVATREPIIAVWFHVATHVYQQYGGSPYYTNGHLQAKRVYAIEAPDWSSPTAAAGETTALVDGNALEAAIMVWKGVLLVAKRPALFAAQPLGALRQRKLRVQRHLPRQHHFCRNSVDGISRRPLRSR